MQIRTSSTLALSATLACTVTLVDDTTGVETTAVGTDTGDTTTPTPTTTTPGGTTVETSVTSTSGTTGEPTTGELPPDWCHGFSPNGPMTLVIRNGDNEEILADGSVLPLECGGQGSLMFPIYPSFGGFEPPNGESVAFSVTLDVEGYNVGPGMHFFSTTNYSFEVDCSYDTYSYGYSNSFLAMFPPDAIPDVTAVDGKPGVLHVTLHAPGGDIAFDANVVMRATEEDFGYCGYGGTDTYDSGTETGMGTSTGGTTGGTTSGTTG